jgi:hypothetical protein
MYKKICFVLFFLLIILILYFEAATNKEFFVSSLNIESPIYSFIKPINWSELSFTDKLKIYGSNLDEKYSIFADKYRVKEYVQNLNIPNLNISKTIEKLDKNNKNLDLLSLPKNCVIKSNHGSGDIIIIKNNKIELMKKYGKKYTKYEDWLKVALVPHKRELEKYYQYIKPEIFVEEYLGKEMRDYKFFCINGKVIFSYFTGRTDERCRNIYDANFNLLDFKLNYKNCSYPVEKPFNFDIMIDISEKLSKPFEFVRIDLYLVGNNIYFGEFTFMPDNAVNLIFNPGIKNKKFGKMWK